MAEDAELRALETELSAAPGFQLDFSLAFTHPLPPQLLALWRACCRGSLLPKRADFDPLQLRPHLGWLCVVEVQRGAPGAEDLVYRLIGTGIVDMVGRDATGKPVSQVLPPGALTIYRHLIAKPRPARSHGQVAWRGKGFIRHESLLLPLADDGRTVDRFLVEMVFPEGAGKAS
jgi:hypothetical protein